MDYRELIEQYCKEWNGAEVIYEGNKYKVIDVDYNGGLSIDKKAKFTDTTAVAMTSVKKIQNDGIAMGEYLNCGDRL